MMDETQAKKLAERILSRADKLAPGAEWKLSLTSGRSANTRLAQNQITSCGDGEETTIELTLLRGKRIGRVYCNQTDEASIKRLVERADMMARLAPEDPERMPLLPPQRYRRISGAYDAATEGLGAEARAQLFAECVEVARARELLLAGFFKHDGYLGTLANSAGLFAQHRASAFELSLTARTRDGASSGWSCAYGDSVKGLQGAALAAVACDKAARGKSPTELLPGRYTVVLEPAAVAELLLYLLGALDARSADEGRSFFAGKAEKTKLGQKLFADFITLRSDAADPELRAFPYDDEGLPLAPLTAIEGGVLKELLYTRYWADKKGRVPTGWRNAWKLLPGQSSREALIADCKRGVLVTRIWYTSLHDPQSLLVTGLTRDGTFLIEDGRITRPVHNFRFNESIPALLKNVEAMSRDTVRIGELRVPAIRAADFHFTSVSKAV